jgi:DNA-binding GntR family transcriptional regulator
MSLIIARIDSGELLPGDAIGEQEMMELCGVSRTPVREAFIRLETDGLIQRHPRKGAIIFRPTIAEFLTILEVHANLESFAAGLAAQRITADLEVELKSIVADCEVHADTHGPSEPGLYYQLNLRFHEVIVRSACNDVLLELVKTNARKLMAYYRLRYRHPNATKISANEHRQIADHILARRSDEAAAAMLQHFNYDRQTVMDLIASVG